MTSSNPAPWPTIPEKCALDEKARACDVSLAKEERTCDDGDEDKTTRPTRIISGWCLTWAWLLWWGISVNFLRLGIETPSNIVPPVHKSNPPIPLIDNNYFLAFGIIMNSLNCIDGLVTRIRKDRSIAPVLLFCAVCTGTISAAAGATALEVLMIFIPLGIATGFTAIYFTSRPKAPEPKEISEKSSNMV